MTVKSKAITIKGKVQQVGFRYFTLQAANRFGISGFVKNQVDGSVYIEAEAEESKLELFVDWCKQGPDHARVDETRIDENPVMNYSGFRVST
ncbi:MAG: acylphosphatase [Bacteroidota bacterium]|nr:acylphosphatase [Bacteroidota bacterium]